MRWLRWVNATTKKAILAGLSASRVFTGGLRLAIFLAFAMITFVLMEEGRTR